jgi:hypothetical protein
MAITTAIANKSLKEIIGEVTISLSPEPNEVYSKADGWEFSYDQWSDENELYNRETGKLIKYHQGDTKIVVELGKIYVYKKTIYCGLSEKEIPASHIFYMEAKRITSPYKIKYAKMDGAFIYEVNYNIVPFINLGRYNGVHFIFNITDVRMPMMQFVMSNNERRRLSQSCIPTEVIEYILPFADFLKINENGNASPLNLKCEYSSEFFDHKFNFREYGFKPSIIISKAQIKQLFNLGIIKMVASVSADIYRGLHYEEFGILSDEGFDNEPAFQQRFGSKEKMHEFIQHYMESHFF